MQRRSVIPKEIRERVLARSGNRCALCGRASDLELAHLIKSSEGGDTSVDNLIALCRSCNYALDSNPNTSIGELQRQHSTAYGFERLVSEVFHRLGFAVLGGATGPDGGVDVVARRQSQSGASILYIVECKSSPRPLTKEQIERFAEKASQYRATSGILITDAQLTPAASETARLNAVRILNINDIEQLASELEASSNG
jgi:restriction endonuclease Mrr